MHERGFYPIESMNTQLRSGFFEPLGRLGAYGDDQDLVEGLEKV